MGAYNFPDLVAPWQRVPLVHDDTDLFPDETMDALDSRYIGAGDGGTVPDGGSTGDVLTKDSGTDQDISWQAPPAIPTELVPDGGSTGQVLTKDSGTDQDVSWQTPDTSANAAVNTVAATGSTETLNADYQLHKVTMDANCTFTFTSPSAGAVFAVLLSGAFVPTWPGSVDWPDGTLPTYMSPSLYVFATFDGGTTWEGVQSGKAFA